MGNRLATIDMGRKLGAMPLWGGAGSPSNTVLHGPRSTSLPSGILIHPAVWPQQARVENWGDCAPLDGGSPSNTMWPAPRPTSIPSGIWSHPAVWPQQTWAENCGWLCPFLGGSWVECMASFILISPTISPQWQTDRQTDNGPIALGEPFYKRSPKKFTEIIWSLLKLWRLHVPHVRLWYSHICAEKRR